MLVELSIANFAIIDALQLRFGAGLTVFTGETGTGKSIIVDAVSLLLGGRASVEMIRSGADEASVEGLFSLDVSTEASLRPLLQEWGVEQGPELILRRSLSRDRRNVCRVNGHALTLGQFQEIGSQLIDIHGQGEHLSLLRVRSHLDFLDRYGNLLEQRSAFGELARRLRQVRAELQTLKQDARELARRADLLAFQVNEIQSAALDADEEAALKRERLLLANAEKLLRLAAEAHNILMEGEETQRSVQDLLATVVDDLLALAKVDDTLREQQQLAEGALYQLEELARTLRAYRDSIEYDPARLQTVEDRLELIRRLKLKYGDSIEQILAFARKAEAELNNLNRSEERSEELQREEAALLRQIAISGRALSVARREAAERLRLAVQQQLADLSMAEACFSVAIDWEKDPTGAEIDGVCYGLDASGLDRVEFFISANPGEEPKPLVKVASGGEVSRLMLAMKTALSQIDPLPTLIFDEIDTGIGGRAGDVLGRKLWSLARDHQVFCVTHLPQISCYADQHLRVVKEVVEGRTVSRTLPLSTAERVEELAVMLGGVATEATRRSAAELLKRVNQLQPTQGAS